MKSEEYTKDQELQINAVLDSCRNLTAQKAVRILEVATSQDIKDVESIIAKFKMQPDRHKILSSISLNYNVLSQIREVAFNHICAIIAQEELSDAQYLLLTTPLGDITSKVI